MRVLITGGTGSLGSLLVGEFVARGDTVTVLSRDGHKQAALLAEYPQVRALLGDVCDEDVVWRAVKNQEVVIHAAALKRIERGQTDPWEYLRVNTLGSKNVIDQAVRAQVGKCILISTDKSCLDFYSSVSVSNNRSIPISKLVKNKLDIEVQSLVDGKIVNSRVANWYKNKRLDRAMYRVNYERAKEGGVVLTEDHLIMTSDGWKRADSIANGSALVTSEQVYNNTQLSMIVGTLMGDASLISKNLSGRSRLAISHCEKQYEWLHVKYNVLSGLVDTVPVKCHKKVKSKILYHFKFSTRSSASLGELRDKFYINNKKIVPRDLFTMHLNPIMLATWFMDDGCLTYKNARIATHGFTFDDVDWIVEQLNNYGIECYAYKFMMYGKEYRELRLTVPGTKRLFSLIGHLVPPSMRYKLLDGCAAYDPSAWNLGNTMLYHGRAIVTKLEDTWEPNTDKLDLPQDNKNKVFCKRGHELIPENCIKSNYKRRQCRLCVNELSKRKRSTNHTTRDVYCIDVENAHNFVSSGIIVHNCAPLNLYGITKRAAEYLWLSHKYCNSVIRYGNVMDSAGSVWWHWQRLLKMGLPLSVREPAPTRFFLLRQQAVALVLDALEYMRGGEIFIPRDIAAVDLHDLARALQPEPLWIREPLLPGEKQHEVLAAPDEFVVNCTPKLLVLKQGENRNPELSASIVSHCSATARRLSGADVVAQLRQITV